MKHIFTFLAIVIAIGAFSQAPQIMSYQAVVRNSNNQLITNTTVGMQISILQGSTEGTAVYVETHSPKTNANGLVSIEIGAGTVKTGTMASIDWSNGPYFIKTETDISGGSNYTIEGISQLLTVPYAFHAETADHYTETDPVFESSAANGISDSDINNWNSKLDSETDPVFDASVASEITSTDITNWNKKLESESDPVFGASAANGITSSDITNWNNKVGSESDPVFGASAANGITSSDITNWNNKVGSESDPVFGASAANGITSTDITNWNNKLESEADPVFGASIASGITGTDTAYWNDKLDSESDPVFGASAANGITSTDITNWNNKLDAEVDGDSTNEIQDLSQVLSEGNSASAQIKDLVDPTDAQDAATKAYVDAFVNILYLQGALKPEDGDGNFYGVVKIGDQLWMTENLVTTTYNDGTPIANVTGTSDWSSLTTPAYCWYNNDSASNDALYGKLYNWYTVNSGDVCPVGWRVPTDADWTELGTFLGGNSSAGGKLKETGTTYWYSPNTGATNETGFSARGTGYRWSDGTFFQKKGYGVYWSSSVRDSNYSWMRAVFYDESQLYRDYLPKTGGFSIRCVRDYK